MSHHENWKLKKEIGGLMKASQLDMISMNRYENKVESVSNIKQIPYQTTTL
jgi:hypothetical protein